MSAIGRLTFLLLATFVAAGSSSGLVRTEEREACAERHPLRNPYFGDTHVHTSFSFDASALGVRNTPRDAYRFARGERLGIQPYDADGRPLRSAQLERPIDFAIVTDHAELLGETHICNTPEAPGHDSLICQLYRRWPLLSYIIVNSRIFNAADPVRYSFCGMDGEICRSAALGPWTEIQAAAEEAYDRSAACRFTTFVGYEWSGNPESNMIHRNVIFRNAAVPDYPTSYVDENTPEGLWRKLRSECLDSANGCDVLTIPHNSNLSGGWLFKTETSGGDPLRKEHALERAFFEPLVEIMQHKGDSECRLGLAADELCDFEKLPFANMDQQNFPFLWSTPPQLSYVREVLGEGLALETQLGVNPFKLGIVASTDSHLGTPGLVAEDEFLGHAAGGDTSRLEIPWMPDRIEFNPGGLAVLWAEENSRDALFEAMRRREAYGTSGPRMIVRFFGGWKYPEDMCARSDFAAVGYAQGVPMGSDLRSTTPSTSPTFAISALKDPGTADKPGVDLQRIQIIKLWLADGRAQEKVFEVAGDPNNGAGVNPHTCEPVGEGFKSLCTVWRDPEFDPAQPALYYARAVENPTCRWSAYVCNTNGVDCSKPSSVPRELRSCCNTWYPRTIQERAWTSPIWYTPPAPARDANHFDTHRYGR
jgi:hypothetical protein